MAQVLIDAETEAFDGGEDVGFELAGRGVQTALQLFARQFGEPAFDPIDPRGGNRREVDIPKSETKRNLGCRFCFTNSYS